MLKKQDKALVVAPKVRTKLIGVRGVENVE
jgi:hypothetical protein